MSEEKIEEPQGQAPAAAEAKSERESIPYELTGEIRLLAENAGHALMCTPSELSDARRKASRFYDGRRAKLLADEFEKPADKRDKSVMKLPKQCPEELLDEYTGLVIADKAHRLAKGFVLRRVGIIQELLKPPTDPPEQGAAVPQPPPPSAPAPEIAQAADVPNEVPAEA